LAALERKKIEDELKEVRAFIKECDAILKDPKKVDKIMIDEVTEIWVRSLADREIQQRP
jgi:DNA gyrase/topoisomerase IV subunit A